MQDLNDMMVFLAVVEAGSFTKAADRLVMPKANVSRKVTKLESELGIMLLQRSTRSQQLTAAGKRFLIHCKQIAQELELAQAVADDELHSVSGNIKVGMSVSIGQEIVKPVLAEFMRRYPKVNLQISLSNQRVDMIEGGFDLMIRVGQLDDSNLIAKHLGQAKRSLFTSPDYLARLSRLVSLNSLTEQQWIVMSQSVGQTGFTLHCDANEHVIRFTPRLVVDDFPMVKQATLDGLGVTALPDYMCEQEVKAGSLVKLLPDWQLKASDMFALYPKGRAKLPRIEALIAFLSEVFADKLN